MGGFDRKYELDVLNDVSSFVARICSTAGMVACLVRLRKASVKKIMEAARLQCVACKVCLTDVSLCERVRAELPEASPGANEEEVKLFSKKLGKDLTAFEANFSEKTARAQQQPSGQAGQAPQDRQIRMLDAPADVLGMDHLVMRELQQSSSTALQFLDRQRLTQRLGSGL